MSTNIEQAKADFMQACNKDFSKDTCELMWNEVKAKVVDSTPVYNGKITHDASYAELAKTNESKNVRIERLQAQLSQQNTLLERVHDGMKAEDEANKERLIIDIVNNSKYTKDVLIPKTFDELKTIADALEHTDKYFASVTADAQQKQRDQQPKLTVGEWDAEKKQWKGGR